MNLRGVLNDKRFYVAAVLSIAALLVAFQLAYDLTHVINHDEVEHAHVAWLMSQGEVPFVDFMEHHPVLYNYLLIPFVTAFDGLSEIYMSIRLMSLALWAASLAIIWAMAKRFGGAVGALIAVLFLALGVQWFRSFGEARPDNLMLPLQLGSILLLIGCGGRRPRSAYVLSGLLFGLSTAVIPKTAPLFPALGIWFVACVATSCRKREELTRIGLWVIAASAAAGIPMLIQALSYEGFWFWVYDFNRAFFRAFAGERGPLQLYYVLREIFRWNPFLAMAALVGVGVVAANRGLWRSGSLVVLICAFQLLSLWKFSAQHVQYFLPALSMTAVLAAAAFGWFSSGCRKIPFAVVTAIFIAGTFLVALDHFDSRRAFRRYLAAMQYVLDVSEPGDRFLACPAMHPLLRHDAGYYWMNYKFVERALDELPDGPPMDWRSDLMKDPPEWIMPRLKMSYCYRMDELPKELLSRYEYVKAPVYLMRRKDPPVR